MKTTTESDSVKGNFTTAAGPVGKPELILHIGRININQTLITLLVFILFFLIKKHFETFLQGMSHDM